MPKQPVAINFSQGLDTKTDPWQLPLGRFLRLQNSVFDTGGLLKKRNGYGALTPLPDTSYSYLTTYNENLTALGPRIAAYNSSSRDWIVKGSVEPMRVSTLPLVRNSVNQTQCDSVASASGKICTVYIETVNSVSTYKYVIADAETGQNIVAPTAIPVASGAVSGSPRVFLLGNFFVVVFTNTITATAHLQYISISVLNPTMVTTNQDIASNYIPASTVAWDGVVFNNNLYVAYNTTAGGQSVKVTYLTMTNVALAQTPAAPRTFALSIATMMSLCADDTVSTPLIYISFYDSAGSTGYTAAVDAGLNVILAPTQIIAAGTILNLATAAQDGVCTVFEEVSNNYSYDSTIPTHHVQGRTITSAGALGTAYVVIRSVGLASKAFIVNSKIYFLSAFQSPFQPSYFLINGSTSTAAAPVIVGKLAYENGGGYLTLGLPGVSIDGTEMSVPYLFKDLIEALTVTNNTQQTTSGGIYSQTGINLGRFDFTSSGISTTEIGQNLHLSGGFLGMYDGYLPVEHNFFLWPDSLKVATNPSAVTPTGTVTTGSNIITAVSAMTGVGIGSLVTGTSIPANQVVTGFTSDTITFGPLVSTGNHTAETITVTGNISTAQQYYYQAIYEWSDNHGNIHRSAGSIPVTVTTTGTTSTNTINIPTLRLTMKVANPVKIVLYRWSAAQQVYHQVTSLTAPLLNSTTVDSVVIYDPLSDASIQGNSIIYTNGGVVENVNAPATNIMTLFDTRLWLVDAEDQNLLWYSKQVIEAVPVEMSDVLTLFVAPNTGTTATTGPATALAPMDDKLIIFKGNAIYYLNGAGPDNTGANNQYSQPTFVTSTVGCIDTASVVLMNDGLEFKSNKGTWLLNRGLQVSYIGAAVEAFNAAAVNSANNIPQTNQVRQTLDSGLTLMYDYYYQQWGTFKGAPAVSSCIYQNLHTYINNLGRSYKETPGVYLDDSSPVLMGFTTGWINVAALQGFERLYYFYLVGKYLSPHKLQIQVAYNYVDTTVQSLIINPTNFSASAASPFGDQPSPFGSETNLEQWKVHARQQKCQSFKISVDEIYDPSFGVAAGAGLTLSGINMMVSVKRATRPLKAANTVG